MLPPKELFNERNVGSWDGLIEFFEDFPDAHTNGELLSDMYEQNRGKQYENRYHPDAIAKDTDGNYTIQDDWSLPFVAKQNSVEFNHHIEHQIDFGVQELTIPDDKPTATET
jgi:hypothetical protein